MPERRLLWGILAYTALTVIAFARQAAPISGSRRIPTCRDLSSEGARTRGGRNEFPPPQSTGGLRGKFHGLAGRTSSGGPIRTSMTAACWP